MWLKHQNEVPAEEVTMYGTTNTTIQWLVNKDEGIHYAMRRFVMKPGAIIGKHHHPEEHEIYILQGDVEVYTDEKKVIAKQGDVLFVPPEEPHGYNNIGDIDCIFLCIIPLLDKN